MRCRLVFVTGPTKVGSGNLLSGTKAQSFLAEEEQAGSVTVAVVLSEAASRGKLTSHTNMPSGASLMATGVPAGTFNM